MANFFLIDQSLRGTGGHHADYTDCIAQAADEMGFQTVIGGNTRLRDASHFERYGTVQRVFRNTIYQRESYLAGLQHLTRSSTTSMLHRSSTGLWGRAVRFWKHRRHQSRRERLIRAFATDCDRFFRSAVFSAADHAFFTAVSEIELMGLAVFLANNPRTLQVQWHLQFHFNLFDGRPPEYSTQMATARLVQSCFESALARVPYHAIHFYTTSETLAEQYDQLGVGHFENLPYPISNCFRFNESHGPFDGAEGLPVVGGEVPSNEPLRITCPGQPRREKGFIDYLQPLVNKVWDSHLESGRVRFVVQRPKSRWFRRRKLDIKLPTPGPADIQPIEYRPHPLPENDYVNLLKSSDCGMLFYDSRVYFSRRAGVLGELLSCGKPVIVPAGSWLSDQIQPAIQSHVEDVLAEFGSLRELDLDRLTCSPRNVPLPGQVFSFDGDRHPFLVEFTRQPGEDAVIVDYGWHWPEAPGHYCRVDVVQTNASGVEHRESQTVGRLRDSTRSSVLFNLLSDTSHVAVEFRNAFDDSNVSLRNLRLITMDVGAQRLPTGAVGIVAADEDSLEGSIAELVEHYDHYRKSAESFSHHWYSSHEPKRTIARLMSRDQAMARSA